MYKVSALDSQHSKKGRDQSPDLFSPYKTKLLYKEI